MYLLHKPILPLIGGVLMESLEGPEVAEFTLLPEPAFEFLLTNEMFSAGVANYNASITFSDTDVNILSDWLVRSTLHKNHYWYIWNIY